MTNGTALPARRVHCIFEGGGAKGYAHVGVLAELEAQDLAPTAFAGTSAGAIVATLGCLGYRARDLIDVHPDGSITHLLQRLLPDGGDPMALLGAGGAAIARVATVPPWYARRVQAAGAARGAAPRGTGPWRRLARLSDGVATAVAGAQRFHPLARAILAGRRGLSDHAALEAALTAAFEDRLGPGAGRETTFDALRTRFGCPPLRIVVADITRGRMVLCSAETTPDVPVIAAVCASAAIPGFFEPVTLTLPDPTRPGATTEALCVDGGLTSNLPGWAFEAERAIDREAVTLLSEIEDEGWTAPGAGGLSMVEPVLRTGIFGTKALGLRGLGPTLRVTLSPEIGVTDFAPARGALATDLEQARNRTRIVLNDDERLTRIVETMARSMKDVLAAWGLPDGRLRAALATAVIDDTYSEEFANGLVQLRHCFEYEQDSDYRQVLSFERSVIGNLMRSGKPAFLRASDAKGPDRFLGYPVDARAITQRRRNLTWWMVVPISFTGVNLPFTNVALVFDGANKVRDSRVDLYVSALEDWVEKSKRLSFVSFEE
ncbi:MAG: patatin-like phospholipase family protein [Shimia sp.]